VFLAMLLFSNSIIYAQDIFVLDGTYYKVKSNNGVTWPSTDLIGHRWSGQQDYTSILVTGNSLNNAEIRLMANGNVGIGATNPQSRLAVNGTITAKQLKVIQTGWPDYVFDSSYALPDLSALVHYLKAERHLPGIPSALEIENNGLDVEEIKSNRPKNLCKCSYI
jgi:hypothetical protein